MSIFGKERNISLTYSSHASQEKKSTTDNSKNQIKITASAQLMGIYDSESEESEEEEETEPEDPMNKSMPLI